MSNKTFTMSAEKVGTTGPRGGLQLGLSPDSHYSNSSTSPSPDSGSSISNMSDTEASSSPDINMLECLLSEGSSVDSSDSSTLPHGSVFCGASTNLNQTFVATPLNSSMDFWNKNLSLSSRHEQESDKYRTFSKNTDDGSSSAATTPDSAGRESLTSSRKTSSRGSIENDWCSVSSGEMMIRNNSFCLEDQSLLLISSQEDSSLSPASGHPALSSESNLLLTSLPDVCESSMEKIKEETAGHPHLGTTFTQADTWELPPEESDIAACDSLVALPSEGEGGLLMTFVCETSPADSGKEAHFGSAEAEQLAHFPGAITPEQGKAFVSTLSATQETDKDIHTSTPVQNLGNAIPSLPSLSVSPCTADAISPVLHCVKQQPASGTPKPRLVATLLPAATKVKKTEIRKFPKSDMSKVKSKVMTRTVCQIAVPGPASQHKPSQVHKLVDAHRAAAIHASPANSSTAVVSATAKRLSVAPTQVNTGAANLGVKMVQSCERTAVNGQSKSRASPLDQLTAANKQAPAVQSRNDGSDREQAASLQHAGNQTFCLSSSEKSLDGESGQIDPRPAPKKGMSDKIEVTPGSALGQDKLLVTKTRLRCSSEGASWSTRPPKEKKTTSTLSASFTVPRPETHLGHTNPGNLTGSSQTKRNAQAEASKGPARPFKKISLVAQSGSVTAGAPWDESKSRLRVRPSPRQTRGAPPASPRAATPSTRQRQAAQGRDESRTPGAAGTPQSKLKAVTGIQRRDQSLGPASAAAIKPKPHGSQPPQTPTRPSYMGPPATPFSRLPRKTLGPSSDLGEGAGSTKVSTGAASKQTPLKSFVLKPRLISTPGKSTVQTLTAACKPAASAPALAPLKRTPSARFGRLASGVTVDKNKAKVGPRQQHPAQPHQSHGPPDVVPPSVAKGEKKEKGIQQLKELLTASNCRFEALTVVLQQTLTERDEATRHRRELSQELVNLRGDLVCSVHSSERLEKEKEELRVSLEEALQELQEQHQRDVADLEQRLQAFYQAEWDKLHLTYQEEADKCKSLMQQQIGELKASHEALKLELQRGHTEQLQSVRQQYETSLEELRKGHREELESLDKTLKDAESSLSARIQELQAENNALIEKLTAVENRRKELALKSQKDSHTLYLQQELESLKVVLDIKNKQLHQQEKKMMEIDKLTEKNVKLDENLKKVQQENEDFRARMERHAALSRQLSTEQAVLQESLHKESKVNKRLSMENEELMWKLHNGDLSSPRKASPTSASPSPSHSFNLQSPRSSGVFSSPPVSPR